jgi:hypothetical protein
VAPFPAGCRLSNGNEDAAALGKFEGLQNPPHRRDAPTEQDGAISSMNPRGSGWTHFDVISTSQQLHTGLIARAKYPQLGRAPAAAPRGNPSDNSGALNEVRLTLAQLHNNVMMTLWQTQRPLPQPLEASAGLAAPRLG